SERAFSIVGPFGSGKSAFGLFDAHFLQRSEQSRRQLLSSLKVADAAAQLRPDAPSLLAVLVPGNNSSLRLALLASLGAALADQRLKTLALDQLRQTLDTVAHDAEIDPARVAELVAETARLLHAHGYFKGV